MKKTKFALLAACGLLAAVSAHAQNTAFIALQGAPAGGGTSGVSLAGYSAPGAAPILYTIGGLNSDSLVSIDYLSTSGGGNQLYGIAASGNVYSLSQTSPNGYTGTLGNTLAGTAGFTAATTADFNPTVNRLRVFAGTANFRITPAAGGPINNDGTLTYNGGDVAVGTTPALGAAAYTNNFFGSTATGLYSLDTTRNTLVLNTGGPQFSGLTTIGPLTLGVTTLDITPGNTGFDVTTINGVNTAYLSNGNTLYTVNLANGALTSLGTQTNANGIIDVAFSVVGSVPEPGTYALIAAGGLLLGVVAVRRRRQLAA